MTNDFPQANPATTMFAKTLQGLGMLNMSVVLWVQGFSDSMVLWFR